MTHTTEPRAPGTSPEQQAEWRARYGHPPDVEAQHAHLLAYVEAIREAPEWSHEVYNKLVRRLARAGHPILPKAQVRRGVLALIEAGDLPADPLVLRRLQRKPTRTQSGVAPVTVLTRPYPCPGTCIYCPDDVRMPRSYLSNEPGAMRALMLEFDPYRQTRQRVEAMERIGHATDKVELLILGGTWSAYPRSYQAWFVRRCLDALNSASPDDDAEQHDYAAEMDRLIATQAANESAAHRCVGLTVETRPDRITPAEAIHLRRLGATRVQIGLQSLDDAILIANRRGHSADDSRRAVSLLRRAGFKVAVHWMPNLLGATPASDLVDFARLWDDPALRPDELKIYPTGLIRGTPLYDRYLAGAYRPYDEDELIDLLAACKAMAPPYVRINRVMRDIPAPDIAAGVTTSNLRQVVQRRLREAGTPCACIRCREVRREAVDAAGVRIDAVEYDVEGHWSSQEEPSVLYGRHGRELFLRALTPADRLAGFLRLSLPLDDAPIEELAGCAIIRQVQVYGPMVGLEDEESGAHAQHRGIGGRLIERALAEASAAGFARIAVIAAVGTREYYRRHGFELGELYMSRAL